MAFLVALAVAVVVTPIAAAVARRTGVVDVPGPLKTHREPVPYLGGFAVLAGLTVGVVVVDRLVLLVPLGLALVLGVADDVRPLPAGTRLVAEVGVGVVAALCVPGPALVRIATGALVLVLLNAVNLLDGQDGLAAAVAAVSALGFAALGGDGWSYGLALAGALVGFLVFNRPPARIYLGDGGAYLVGTALALGPALVLAGTSGDAPGLGTAGSWSVWLATPLLVAVPLADTAIAVVRRMRSGAALFAGDRSHVYDQLVDRGWTVLGSTVVLALVQAVGAGAGVLAARRGPAVALAATVLGALVVTFAAVRGGFVAGAGDGPG